MINAKEILQQAFESKHTAFFDNDNTTITLIENDANNGLSNARIFGVCGGSLLIGLHKSGPVPSLIKMNKIRGFHKKCDYILFTKIDARPTIFFIELKSETVEEKAVIGQLKGAACIADYLKSFSLRFLEIQPVDFEERFVVFYRSRQYHDTTPLLHMTHFPFTSNKPNTLPDYAIALPDPDKNKYTVQDLIRN
jgi:hypothetical protein